MGKCGMDHLRRRLTVDVVLVLAALPTQRRQPWQLLRRHILGDTLAKALERVPRADTDVATPGKDEDQRRELLSGVAREELSSRQRGRKKAIVTRRCRLLPR